MQENYKEILLSPIKIGTRVCQNRFWVQAMECTDADEEGNPTDWTIERYENLFRGGHGVVTLEALTVTDKSRSRLAQLSIMPRNAEKLKKFIQGLKAVNPKVLIVLQLTHSGELSNPAFSKRVTVKPLPGFGGELLQEEDVEEILQEFVTASRIAYEAGADGVDLKLCHGYLGSQILRPYNDRKWKYGGPWENRRQFAFDLFERVRAEVNDENFLLGTKISMWEGFPGGFGTEGPDSPIIDLTEPLDLIKGLEERGANYFVQSGGSPSITTSITQAEKKAPYFAFLHNTWAKEMKKVLKPETVVIGSNYSVFRDGKNGILAVEKENNSMFHYGAKFIAEGKVDMVAVGRQSFADPLLPKKLEEGKEKDIKWCTICDNCLELLIRQKPIGCCTFNKRYTEILVNTRKECGPLKVKHT
ncbi:2,4-dienoyl-CoA reductase [Faecalicatena contorta]|jgi:2,4-dienoyl-CoA reductase-like NADH-dependent reductase (Old Yellow Enzyme family)|uniref:2,4-dienoyl-CoA reductase n=1 Tax=Faecalicatena contorta TaxID=39482 RepID=A0A316AKQ3_9FIRM|nr:2,4-dienoyl-CoA reductase [Faecalicatena contorta]PWJ50597.1 2,4-dienoyl-CoA reductase-like NADH-dependent reductase (Old Yellow Enzyme family) [Faecalicatena contorta]SUQ14005.1 2,4-dienoyl-CoA reductase [Faecalicatena contorta]